MSTQEAYDVAKNFGRSLTVENTVIVTWEYKEPISSSSRLKFLPVVVEKVNSTMAFKEVSM
jgi:hypothetical protein